MARELRAYQAEGVGATYEEWKNGNTRTAVVLPTGVGKTDLIAKVATDGAHAGENTLVLAHRSELLDQITARCKMHDPAVPVGRVQADTHMPRRPITVAMAPTAAKPKRRAQMVRPDRVIVDECHHAASPSYVEILRWAGCFDEVNPTPLMGVTATFTRGDKRGLGDVFQSVAYSRDVRWAIDEGWLVQPHGRVVVGEHMDLEHAKTSRGDYQDGELGEMFAQDVDQVVSAWFEHASDRLTAAFTPNVDSARTLAEEFRGRGVPVGEVYGTTPHGERQRVYADLAAGRIRVLVNVMVATEGFDCPPISCVLMGRPTKLPGLYAQMVGRGLRLAEGKSDCLVLDVVGASRTQRLVTLIDLVPSATYDDTEIEVLPCDACEGYLGRKPAVIRLAEERGMEPCSCPCPECGGWTGARAPVEGMEPCRCGEGDGADLGPGRRKLNGPARYAEVDLLGLAERAGGESLNWLATEGGTPFLSAGKRFACIYQEDNGLYSAAHVAPFGAMDAQVLCEFVSLEHARALVERWAHDYCEELGVPLYGREAGWRLARAVASENQQKAAKRIGIADPENYTKGGISDAMDVVRASRRFDR